MTTSGLIDVDLFAGPGGWDHGLRLLRRAAAAPAVPVLGVELDRWACATRLAEGHPTVRADVGMFPVWQLAGKVRGQIGSPPCTMFTQAGSTAAWLIRAILCQLARDVLAGNDTRAERRAEMFTELAASDWPKARGKNPAPRTPEQRVARITAAVQSAALIAEPARFIAAARPEWIVLEQVSEALPVWHAYAEGLKALGYSTWAGKLNAADYGVPQTRKRAILIASRTRPVGEPAGTHYDPAKGMNLTAFTPWVTMFEAIGRGATAVPVPTITAGGTDTGGAEPWPTRARRFLASEMEAGRWSFRVDAQSKAVRRTLNQPAQTIKAGHSAASEMAWISPEREASLLEPWEAAVLQSFPADYRFAGGRGRQFQQIGNAVPPLLAAVVAAEAMGVACPARILDLAA
jgi:DNA (cytosine-5)-methyltransferase 1